VCIDACFTHKRRNPAKGGEKSPENLHPDTVFVPEKNVAEMKALVESVCPEKSKKQYFTLPLLFQWIPTDFCWTLPFLMDPADSPLDFHQSPLESIRND